MPKRLDVTDPGFAQAFEQLVWAGREKAADVDGQVRTILDDVRLRGDAAVTEYTRKFDRLDLLPAGMRVTTEEMDAAGSKCAVEALDALTLAAERIESFHRRQMPEDEFYEDSSGVGLGWRWTALKAVGLYVPGGSAAYPSSVLMNAIPAKVAGVERLAMVVPSPDGVLNPHVLAAASIAGVDEIYRIGGAQAIGALAYGTATIDRVDKIVGPGNAYVASAKKLVFGVVGIDMIAGPSEVLVVADADNNPDWIAADLLAQAEHDEAAQAVLITDDAAFGDAVADAVNRQLETLERKDIAAASWRNHGAIIRVCDFAEAPALVDSLAPEHLEVALDNADAFARGVHNAGAVFLGRYTPEAIGDYIGGTNHVLPTDRSARFSSGLSVLEFMKRTSLLRCDAKALAAIGPAAVSLARVEGLGAHARSVAIRLNIGRDD
jgi:histidinol dehydrogenase